eukprot:TRINITY_DN49394_c0_g1_i1.p1 TRINITY_DN49394_c0_g1~~TRINITY_DN49394_c0_g1_i1.p1  ORF type:complete len:335 (+),score=62.07 TRINITY_DN49394_c0_g1_i1:267-1271(+)
MTTEANDAATKHETEQQASLLSQHSIADAICINGNVEDVSSVTVRNTGGTASLWEILGSPQMLAFVGGGGKTTLAIRSVAEACVSDMGGPTVLTTTTRMFVPRVPQDVDVVVVADQISVAQGLLRKAVEDGHGRVAVIGGIEETLSHGRRAIGVPVDWPAALLGEGLAAVAIIEADGSRKLPFKAPRAPQEPVIPTRVSVVVAVAGVDCLGASLVEERVCRADVVARIAGVELGECVTAEVVGCVLGQRSIWCHTAIDEAERSPNDVVINAPHFYAAVNKVDVGDAEKLAAGKVVVEAILRHQSDLRGVLLTGQGDTGRGSVIEVFAGKCANLS